MPWVIRCKLEVWRPLIFKASGGECACVVCVNVNINHDELISKIPLHYINSMHDESLTLHIMADELASIPVNLYSAVRIFFSS
jgi:hypothetical protein